MRSKRFLYSKEPSKCCNYKTLLVRSMTGGFVTRNCLKCGRRDTVSIEQLPDLNCDFCGYKLDVQFLDRKNYFYICPKCNKNWKLADFLPDWFELFEYSGIRIHGEERI